MKTKDLNRRGLFRLALAGLVSAPALTSLAQAQESAGATGAVAPVQALSSALLAVMRDGKTAPFASRFAALAPVVDRTFDLPTILQTSVGLRWSSLPPDQQAQLQTVFRRYTVATFVANFDSFSGQQITVSPTPRSVGAEQIVATRIVPTSGDATELDYVMRQEGGSWRAVDVLADGSISRVAVQRSDFRELLTDGTGQQLVASLNHKIATLSDGSLA